MAMSLPQGGNGFEEMVEINTTPLIDVMLVLLIMLIITLPIQTHAVKLDMPRPNQSQPLEPPPVVDLIVDFDGTVYWNGTRVPDSATLASYLRRAANADVQPELHIRPNRLVSYDAVAKVLSAAQRLGVTKIGVIGNEQLFQ